MRIPECPEGLVKSAWERVQEAIQVMCRKNPPPRSNFAIDEADVHICLWEKHCSGNCGCCYLRSEKPYKTVFEKCKVDQIGFEDMLKVMVNLRYAAGAKYIVFVGGDPCEHPNLVEFLIFAKAIGLDTCVLSNTHRYLMGGQEVDIETVTRYGYLDEIDVTIHGTRTAHDRFNGSPGSYDYMFDQVKKYEKARDEYQSIGIVLNMTPYLIGTAMTLNLTMTDTIIRFGLDPERDFFTIQRIAPAGLALKDFEKKWAIDSSMINDAFNIFDIMKDAYGIETRVCIDAFPWCAIDKKYWHYLKPLEGGCNWGRPGGVLSIMPDGMIQRCALCYDHLGVNIKDLDTPGYFTELMVANRALKAANERKHLNEKCKSCSLFEKCGGGCIIASTFYGAHTGKRVWGDPYPYGSSVAAGRYMDYLAKGPL